MIFKDKKITIMGLGLLGGGVEDALFFIKQGAVITITDLRNEKELAPSIKKLKQYKNIKYSLSGHNKEDFTKADMILKNPGVPKESHYLQIAKENNVPVYTSAGIFLQIADKNKIIGVTGTKGKSTTASLIYEVLKVKDKNAYITGLPGLSLLKFAEKAKNSWGVAELSSWQLEGVDAVKVSPHIAVITNIEEDHLNRHKDFNEYREAKKIIFKYQAKKDYLVIPDNLKKEMKDANSAIVTLSTKDNAETALKVAEIIGVDKAEALEAINKFKGLPGRLELVAKINGIKIYNDTTATNPFAAIYAIEKFKDKKTAIILGGEDKKLNYTDLAKKLKKVHFVALLPGSASDKIKAEAVKHETWNKNFKQVGDLKNALAKCINSKPEVILFSPAAASFNMFINEFDRGEQFKQEVKNILSAR